MLVVALVCWVCSQLHDSQLSITSLPQAEDEQGDWQPQRDALSSDKINNKSQLFCIRPSRRADDSAWADTEIAHTWAMDTFQSHQLSTSCRRRLKLIGARKSRSTEFSLGLGIHSSELECLHFMFVWDGVNFGPGKKEKSVTMPCSETVFFYPHIDL